MEEHTPPENVFAEGIRDRRATAPCVIVLFGATGDLTRRKLVPALYNQMRDGNLSERVALVGVARREKSDAQFRADLLEGVREHARSFSEGDEIWRRLAESIFYHRSAFEDDAGFAALARRLEDIDREHGTGGNRLFYLATAPEYFASIVRKLGAAGLVPRPRVGGNLSSSGASTSSAPWSRVVVEKPFGHDLDSARRLNDELLDVLDESQIYRIDHYLGKETVQNILTFRFANGIFEPIWNSHYVDHVQITVAESLGMGSRGPYYDRAGALRDMVQNHMLQLLSLVAMEPPVSVEADAVRDEKVKVLRAIREPTSDEVRRQTVRAQYTSGSLLGETVRAYTEEDRVPDGSHTPTYAAIRVDVVNWRWSGVPFFLRHGKRLPKRATEIAIQFKKPPMPLFSEKTVHAVTPNTLILNIQPDEGISLGFVSKVPGTEIRTRQVKMDFRYGRSFGVRSPDAYERLLLDAIIGDSTLFTRNDEVEHSWRFVGKILDVWADDGSEGLHFYPAGTWGPEAAARLFDGSPRSWRRL